MLQTGCDATLMQKTFRFAVLECHTDAGAQQKNWLVVLTSKY